MEADANAGAGAGVATAIASARPDPASASESESESGELASILHRPPPDAVEVVDGHVALRENADYQALLAALVTLEAQRMQAYRDLDVLVMVRKRALRDPGDFVRDLAAMRVSLPVPQCIPALPRIRLDEYARHGHATRAMRRAADAGEVDVGERRTVVVGEGEAKQLVSRATSLLSLELPEAPRARRHRARAPSVSSERSCTTAESADERGATADAQADAAASAPPATGSHPQAVGGSQSDAGSMVSPSACDGSTGMDADEAERARRRRSRQRSRRRDRRARRSAADGDSITAGPVECISTASGVVFKTVTVGGQKAGAGTPAAAVVATALTGMLTRECVSLADDAPQTFNKPWSQEEQDLLDRLLIEFPEEEPQVHRFVVSLCGASGSGESAGRALLHRAV